MDYQLYLRTPHWRRIKKKYFQLHPRECFVCQGTQEINLHHLHYRTLHRELWSDLVPLCSRCHKAVHERYGSDQDGHVLLRQDYLKLGLALFTKPQKRITPKARQNWAHTIQFKCPKCGANPGDRCFGKGNQRRRYHHEERNRKAKSLRAKSLHRLNAADLTPAKRAKYALEKPSSDQRKRA